MTDEFEIAVQNLIGRIRHLPMYATIVAVAAEVDGKIAARITIPAFPGWECTIVSDIMSRIGFAATRQQSSWMQQTIANMVKAGNPQLKAEFRQLLGPDGLPMQFDRGDNLPITIVSQVPGAAGFVFLLLPKSDD